MLVQCHLRKGCYFIEQTFFGKQMFSSHVYVRVGAYLPYSTVLNCPMVQRYSVGGFSGREVIFTKYPVTAGKLTHRGERMKKKQDKLISYQG